MTCIRDEHACPTCPPGWEHDQCGYSCEVFSKMMADPATHHQYHDAHSCDVCGAPNYTREQRRACEQRCCTIIKCGRCGEVHASWGPINCPCEDRTIRAPKLSRRSARRWRQYVRR